MKRIVFILSLSFMLSLVSCIPKDYEVITEQHNKVLSFKEFVDFRTIATDGRSNKILCDANTGVLYVHDSTNYGGFLSPIYNADGTLKNIKDYAKVEE